MRVLVRIADNLFDKSSTVSRQFDVNAWLTKADVTNMIKLVIGGTGQ
jgi:hypothetical protein